MDTWTAKDLKAYITKQGGSYADCVEKCDLLARAKSLTPGGELPQPTGAAKAPAQTSAPSVSASSRPSTVPTLKYDYGFLHKWRRAWNSHENKARVEAWMGFHASLRAQLTAMGEILNDAIRLSAWTLNGNDLGTGPIDFLDQLATTFKTFVKKIGDHAKYEDQCLFPFFESLLPDFKDMGAALTAQHQEMDAMEIDILDAIATLRTAIEGRNNDEVKRLSPTLLSVYSAYQQLIIEHLASEESSLIGPWLHLTAEQYQDYQDKWLTPHGHGPSSIPMVADEDDDAKMSPVAAELSENHARAEAEKRELAKQEEERQRQEEAKRQSDKAVQEERRRREERRAEKERLEKEEQERQKQQQRRREPPKLFDRHGREVDMKRPGCCFDGVDGCCKGSAYQRLLEKNGYVYDHKAGQYVLR